MDYISDLCLNVFDAAIKNTDDWYTLYNCGCTSIDYSACRYCVTLVMYPDTEDMWLELYGDNQ